LIQISWGNMQQATLEQPKVTSVKTPIKRRVTIHDIKQALLDERFRATLPEGLGEDVQKFLKNPGCACNHPIYLNVIRKAPKQIAAYFPSKEQLVAEEVEKDLNKLAKNDWQVINCHVNELANELRKLGNGRKQLDIARYQDQVTVVVNHLEGIF
jgi:hypothetical protein